MSNMTGLFSGLVFLLAFVVLLAILRRFIRVCPTNQILVITGGSGATIDGREYGFRLQKGGWTVVVPFLQNVHAVDLTIVPINVRLEGVNSANGIKVGADAFACVCVDDENETLLYSAVQQLLGKSQTEIRDQIQKTMIGNFRAALNKTTPLQAIGMVESAESEGDIAILDVTGKPLTPAAKEDDLPDRTSRDGERAMFRSVLLEDCQGDLSPFGIEVVSVSMQRIWDTSNYIANLANKTLSRKRREVEVEEARLHAQAQRAESDAERRVQVAESQADERILETRQEVEVFRREREAQVTRMRLEADSAIAEAGSEGQRSVEEKKVLLQELRNQSEVTLEAEAQRVAAETLSAGDAEAENIVRQAHNDLLAQKVQLLKEHGDLGKLVLFLTQLPAMFESYEAHSKNKQVNDLLVLSSDDGFNRAVNRGPAALVDFMRQLESAFGIDVRQLMGGQAAQPLGTTRVTSANGGTETSAEGDSR
jgi:flotillin